MEQRRSETASGILVKYDEVPGFEEVRKKRPAEAAKAKRDPNRAMGSLSTAY